MSILLPECGAAYQAPGNFDKRQSPGESAIRKDYMAAEAPLGKILNQ
jgi:hypothetical protein